MLFSKKRRIIELVNQNPAFWINSGPLTLELLTGVVVVLHFWTYSNVNCIRTLPLLKELWSKYQNRRCMLIGVHTPEFAFEKDLENVQKAVIKHGIEWPILHDPAQANWHLYGNTYWPRVAVLNTTGEKVFDHVGDADYGEIELQISALLRSIGEIQNNEYIPPLIEKQRIFHEGLSSEIYTGSAKGGTFASSKICAKQDCDEYSDNGTYVDERIHLHGDWHQTDEYIEYRGSEGSGWAAVRYFAASVNFIGGGEGIADILIDGRGVPAAHAGKDMIVTEGSSTIDIDGDDLYSLLQSETFHTGVIKIIPFRGMRLHAFNFGEW